jgi:hypothetical protein
LTSAALDICDRCLVEHKTEDILWRTGGRIYLKLSITGTRTQVGEDISIRSLILIAVKYIGRRCNIKQT